VTADGEVLVASTGTSSDASQPMCRGKLGHRLAIKKNPKSGYASSPTWNLE
jgi:hypothetical protein